MFDLEQSIKQWLKLFRKHRAFNHGSVREMELHLRDHIDDLVSEGYSKKEAFDLAVNEFGEIPEMANEEFANIKSKTTLMTVIRTTMFNNYYKTLLRSLMRNPLSSFINIFGLAAAIAVCVFTYGFAQWCFDIDQFHEHKKEVYLATFFADRDGTIQQNGMSPRPLGAMLEQDFTQIKKMCRVNLGNVVLKHEDKVFHERINFVDEEFLDMFTFPLKWGQKSSLSDVNSIILNEEMSIKYFGETNPIGRHILVKFGDKISKTFSVSGVAKGFPDAHAIHFDFLINFKNYHLSNPNDDANDWGTFVNATLIQVEDQAHLKSIEEETKKYRALQNQVESNWTISSFAFVQLAELYEKSGPIRNGISARGYNDNIKGIIILSVVTLILLLIACFNYINIAIVSAAKRLKEIGIRKSIGASRRNVTFQFLTENIIVTSFALIMGLVLGTTVIIPWFEQLFGVSLGFRFLEINLILFLAVILLFTGLASGIYPALYISKFQVVGILKGSTKFGRNNPLTKMLLGFQLVLSCILIASAVMFTQNTAYIANRSWGYNQDQALYAKVPNRSEFSQLERLVVQDPNVTSIAGSIHHLGRSKTTAIVHMPDREYEVDELSVGHNYFKTMGIELSTGRFFEESHESDKQNVIINKTFVKNLTIDDPIGRQLKIDSTLYSIIGVVEDFHSSSFSKSIEPTLFRMADKKSYHFLSMRVQNGAEEETFRSLQAHWMTLFPETPFEGGFQEDVWGFYFEEIGIHGKIWRGIAGIAIILVSLGIYGLVSLNVSGRVREFSIKKVLGAELRNITSNVINQYVILFGLALVIGAPISYFIVEYLFDIAYVYHIPMNPVGVILSIFLLIAVLFTAVAIQVGKVSKANPVDGLRVE